MLDNLYTNIGGKVKNLAKFIFIIESVCAIITGFILLFTNAYLMLCGLLTLFVGPIVAWVSSWTLYAFGELVEKTCDNKNNTRKILTKLDEITIVTKSTVFQNNTSTASTKKECTHAWRCDKCGNWRTKTPCEHCGNDEVESSAETLKGAVASSTTKSENAISSQFNYEKQKNPDAPYWCGSCGHTGPYDGNCPKCNSSIKIYNV